MDSAALAVGFLGAYTVAKRLPGTIGAQLGWGAAATLGTYLHKLKGEGVKGEGVT